MLTLLEQFLEGLVTAVLGELIRDLPALVGNLGLVNTSTVQTAPPLPAPTVDALNQELNDAIANGSVPPPGAAIHP